MLLMYNFQTVYYLIRIKSQEDKHTHCCEIQCNLSKKYFFFMPKKLHSLSLMAFLFFLLNANTFVYLDEVIFLPDRPLTLALRTQYFWAKRDKMAL